VWKGDEALGAQAQQFHDWMLTSGYWTDTLGEYGVGPGVAKGLVVLQQAKPATIDDGAFEPLIQKLIANGTFPQPNTNTAFAFILPATTKSTLQGGTGCVDFGGYHSEAQVSRTSQKVVPYEVNLQCPGFGDGSPFDQLTDVLSHEASETATDPHPSTQPAWRNETVVTGGEVSDLCVGLGHAYHATVSDGTDGGTAMLSYVVTRNWSNKSSAAGNLDPCVPAPAHPYFNVALDPSDAALTLNRDGTLTATTVKIELFAYGDVGLIKWVLPSQLGAGVNVSPSSGSGLAGDTVIIVITADKTARAGAYPLDVFAESAHGGFNQWWGSLSVQ
jgi:hypothetical protein